MDKNPTPQLDLLSELIRRPSVTPEDAGCQELIAKRLTAVGFSAESIDVGDVKNLWARRGDAEPLLCFAGHTDVVPPGNDTAWTNPPFSPTVCDGRMYGRGAADMKGGLTAMIVAIEQFLSAHGDHAGSIALLLTSDEEGPAKDGTRCVMDTLKSRGESITWCVIGEPSSQDWLGDTIRIGRRGSLSARIDVHGTQGHVAYPELADNPIHRVAPALQELCDTEWDQGNAHFPPTSFQFVEIQSGAGASNVTPGQLTARLNFRFSPESPVESLQQRVHAVLNKHGLDYSLHWHLSGAPFLTPSGDLIDAVTDTVTDITGRRPQLSTGGGTSDGRFIAPSGAEVVELGPINATIHKVDEHVSIDDIVRLTAMYRQILERLLDPADLIPDSNRTE